MAYADVKLTFGYTDESTRDLKVGPFATNASNLTGLATNIKNFNENELSGVNGLLLSDGGASCTGIIDAHIITTNKTEINLND